MVSRNTIAVSVIIAVTFFVQLKAQPTLQSVVVASGGTVVSASGADTILLACTIGQPVISTPPLSASQSLYEGFWVPWMFEMTGVDVAAEVHDQLEVFPNPFSVQTTLRLPQRFTGRVDIALFNLAGERVRTLSTSTTSSDRTELSIDAFDDLGESLPTGMYILEITGAMLDGTRLSVHGIIHLIQ